MKMIFNFVDQHGSAQRCCVDFCKRLGRAGNCRGTKSAGNCMSTKQAMAAGEEDFGVHKGGK